MRSVKAIALAASAALLISSTAAAAATTFSATAVAVQAPAPDAWMMLSVLSPTRPVALGGAAAAAQPAPPPPPQAYGAPGGPVINGEVLTILLWWGLIAIALTISDNGGRPNSPR
jgi:hypothetical protein